MPGYLTRPIRTALVSAAAGDRIPKENATVPVHRRDLLRCAMAGLAVGSSIHAQPPAAAKRKVEVRYEVAIPDNQSAPVSLWLPVPKSDSTQAIEHLAFAGVDRHETYGSGMEDNRYFFAKVPPGRTVRMEFQVTRTERRGELRGQASGSTGGSCCLGPDRLVPLDSRIRKWAQDVVREARAVSDLDKARAIYEHVVETVKYDKSGRGWGRGDIYYACDTRRGNCSDFHAIFIGYARAVNVPAKFVIGLPFPRDRGSGEIAGYHCWAEFFAKGIGWIPIDASEAAKDPERRKYFFGALDENRVELSQGRDVILTPRQSGEPLNFFVYPYGEVNGRMIELQPRIHYRDLV